MGIIGYLLSRYKNPTCEPGKNWHKYAIFTGIGAVIASILTSSNDNKAISVGVPVVAYGAWIGTVIKAWKEYFGCH